ncbi:MAG: hypothetical protein ABJP48_06105 [Erythrobacter sp.]
MTKKPNQTVKRLRIALACGLIAIGLPVAAQSGGLNMLSNLSKGEWSVKSRDGSFERKICIRSGQELIQLMHSDPDCSRFIQEDEASRVKVHYTCPGNGYGRTNIRRETGSLVQVQSEGIVDGLPFQLLAEARRIGDC